MGLTLSPHESDPCQEFLVDLTMCSKGGGRLNGNFPHLILARDYDVSSKILRDNIRKISDNYQSPLKHFATCQDQQRQQKSGKNYFGTSFFARFYEICSLFCQLVSLFRSKLEMRKLLLFAAALATVSTSPQFGFFNVTRFAFFCICI